MLIPKENRIRSKAYLAHIRTQPCLACGAPGPSDAAHISMGRNSLSMKAGDDLTMPLCRRCHQEHDYFPRVFWVNRLMEPHACNMFFTILKAWRAAEYRLWEGEKK